MYPHPKDGYISEILNTRNSSILIFQGQQSQKYKEGPNLLQKAKKSLTSSFESFMSKRVRNKANFFRNYMYV